MNVPISIQRPYAEARKRLSRPQGRNLASDGLMVGAAGAFAVAGFEMWSPLGWIVVGSILLLLALGVAK